MKYWKFLKNKKIEAEKCFRKEFANVQMTEKIIFITKIFAVFQKFLDSYRCFYRSMRIISLKSKIFIFESKEIFHFRIDLHSRKGSWFTRKLFSDLVIMIMIYMNISKSMNKFTREKSTCLSNHHGQECIRCNIEWNTEKYIRWSLIQLTRKLSISYIKLK